MKELATALKRRAGLQMRQGIVTAITGSTCSVLVGGSDMPVEEVQHLNSCQPAVDDVVWITSDGEDLWIIGTHGDQPPIDPSRLPGFVPYFTGADTPGAPSAVTGLEGFAAMTGVILSWDVPPEALWRTWEVYEDTSPDFDPGTPILTTTSTVVTIPRDPGSGPWYFKVRAINSRSEASAYAEVGPFTLPELPSAEIADASITVAKFAQGIVPPRVVATLPTLPDAAYPASSLVILTSDGKLYRTATGAVGSWTNVVNAADLTGTIDAGQIAAGAITASALAEGAITGSKFAPGIKTMQTLEALPDLPNPEYPPGTVIFIPSEGRLYRVQEAVDLIPIMTSNTAPSGVASASSEYNAAHAAWRAFDDADTGWRSTDVDGSPWTLGYEFALARVITWYSVKGCGVSLACSPRAWTFEGWSGSAWVVLDTQANQTGWAAGERRAFDIANDTAYSRYRLSISANVGIAAGCGVDALEMAGWMQAAPTYIKDADIASDAAIAESKLDLTSLLARVTALENAGGGIPAGLIAMWDEFTQGVIPTGWSLCDGLGGRPNLKDKFIVGAKGAYAAGATGGEATHKLVASEVPAHGHTASSGTVSADHGHTFSTGNDSPDHGHGGNSGGRSAVHTHRVNTQTVAIKSPTTGTDRTVLQLAAGMTSTLSMEGESQEHVHAMSGWGATTRHTHSGTTNGINANHNHGITVNSAGGDGYHENRPPYYALCFIMKD